MPKMTVKHISMIALAIIINYVGSQIALVLRLPIYLDSLGTFMIACIYGPIFAMLPSLLSGFILGITIDIYSLYYAPVGILLGALYGLVLKKRQPKLWWILIAALIVTIPASLCSSLITAKLFGGITSSGSSAIVQILNKSGLDLTLSCFIVQVLTDYLDRVIIFIIGTLLIKKLPDKLIKM